MKKTWIGKRGFTLLILAVLLSAGASFGAGPKYTLSVRDKVTSDQTETEDENAGGYTTIVITDTEICTLTVEVKLRGLPSQNCQLEWAFISEKKEKENSDEVVVLSDFGKKSITLQDNVELEEVITSGPFVSTETETETERNTKTKISTEISEGYILVLSADGEVLAVDASSKKYEKDEWVEQVRNAKASGSSGKKNRR